MVELGAYAPNPRPTHTEAIASSTPRSIARNQRAVKGCVTNTAAQFSAIMRPYSSVPKPLRTTASGSANWNCQNTIMKAKWVARKARKRPIARERAPTDGPRFGGRGGMRFRHPEHDERREQHRGDRVAREEAEPGPSGKYAADPCGDGDADVRRPIQKRIRAPKQLRRQHVRDDGLHGGARHRDAEAERQDSRRHGQTRPYETEVERRDRGEGEGEEQGRLASRMVGELPAD